jgi:hypothetical protein
MINPISEVTKLHGSKAFCKALSLDLFWGRKNMNVSIVEKVKAKHHIVSHIARSISYPEETIVLSFVILLNKY